MLDNIEERRASFEANGIEGILAYCRKSAGAIKLIHHLL